MVSRPPYPHIMIEGSSSGHRIQFDDVSQANAVHDVIMELGLQDVKWGRQDHDDLRWLAILGEEVGEAAWEIEGRSSSSSVLLVARTLWRRSVEFLMQKLMGGVYVPRTPRDGDLRSELVHVAAVAVQWVAALDRRAGSRGRDEDEDGEA